MISSDSLHIVYRTGSTEDPYVDKVDSFKIVSGKIILLEIPDQFSKVVIQGYTEVFGKEPSGDKEFNVDYQTGLVSFNPSQEGKTITAVYKGRGQILYPASRIYFYGENPNTVENLQTALSGSIEGLNALTEIGDLGAMLRHTTNSFLLANNDWTVIMYDKQGTLTYNIEQKGVVASGETIFKVRARMPFDPDSIYHLKAKVKRLSGDGTTYVGAVALDNNFAELSTDAATDYNYFVTENSTLSIGVSTELHGHLLGYNVPETGNDDHKLDPYANFIDFVFKFNVGCTVESQVLVEWVEIQRSYNTMHVKDTAILNKIDADGLVRIKRFPWTPDDGRVIGLESPFVKTTRVKADLLPPLDVGDNDNLVSNLNADKIDGYDHTDLFKVIDADAINIDYTHALHPSFATVKDALDELFYFAPDITAMSNSIGTVEKGQTITSVGLSWTLNKAVTSQSLNQLIGAIDASLRSYTVSSVSLTSDTTYTLTVSDGRNSDSRSSSVLFRQKRHWGVSANTSITSADILLLSGEFATGYTQTKSFDCTGGRYIYITFPQSFSGTPVFTVGGLTAPFQETIVSHTNSSGFVENYRVFRSENLQNDSNITVTVS